MSVKMRLLTRTGFRRGPLGRRIDRIEACSRLAMFLVFLIVALPATWYVGDTVSRESLEQERIQQFDRHQVSARLLESAPVAGASPLVIRIPVTAEWTEPDGTHHRGTIRVIPGTRAGSIHTIWTDTSGNPVLAPLGHGDTVATVTGSIFIVLVLIGTIMTGISLLAHRRFDRYRLEQWEHEWRQVGPDWSQHG